MHGDDKVKEDLEWIWKVINMRYNFLKTAETGCPDRVWLISSDLLVQQEHQRMRSVKAALKQMTNVLDIFSHICR